MTDDDRYFVESASFNLSDTENKKRAACTREIKFIAQKLRAEGMPIGQIIAALATVSVRIFDRQQQQ